MYNHAPEGYTCPFCSLAQGQENPRTLSVVADIVYQDEAVMAFVSSHQWPHNPGNVLVVPLPHHESVYDLPLDLAAKVQGVVRAVALAMKAAWGCDGVSTRQHNEPAGNQDVWHYHVHVTPRYAGDEFYASYGRRALMPAPARARYAAALRAHWPGG